MSGTRPASALSFLPSPARRMRSRMPMRDPMLPAVQSGDRGRSWRGGGDNGVHRVGPCRLQGRLCRPQSGAGGDDVVHHEHGATARVGALAAKRGPSRRSSRVRPVCWRASSPTRAVAGGTARPSARPPPGPAPRPGRNRGPAAALVDVGAHVTTSTSKRRARRAMAPASAATTGLALPYFRASSRRRPVR